MAGHAANVIPMPTRPANAANHHARTTVLHAVADEDGLVEVAPIVAALDRRACFRQLVAHVAEGPTSTSNGSPGLTGVHRRLEVGPGTHAERTAAMLVVFERMLIEERPDVVVVAGEDDAALAAAVAAAKLEMAVAHLSAGMRSWDWTLPEEINRSVIDRLSDLLFTSSADATANLRQEGVPDGRIYAVGNARIDMLRRSESGARARRAWREHGVDERGYVLVALQHPASVAPRERLERIASALAHVSTDTSVLLLPHARTSAMLDSEQAQALLAAAGVRLLGLTGYLDVLSLQAGAGAVVTDGGPLQEEASALGVPCFTLRHATARTVTLTHGTNVLLGDDPDAITSVRPSPWAPTPAAIPLWDGRAAERIADALVANYALSTASAEGP